MEFPQERPHHNILDIFDAEKNSPHGFLRASAPMVRYSKFEFRFLLRKYGVKLCFTPMIIADSFNNSMKARENEFTTCHQDQPLIAQIASKNASEFETAAKLIYPYVDGIDLNCGCPQSWAITKGYGCGLLRKPEVIYDIIQTVRRNLPTDFSVSLKIRLLNGAGESSTRATIEFARQLEKCGATFLTLHGRNMWQRSSDPLNIPAMAAIKESLQIPLICNGNVQSWQDACDLYEQTKADGIMSARGLLSNPTIFKGECKNGEKESTQCVEDWLNIATQAGNNIKFQTFHHHLTFMWGHHMKRNLRQEFNNFTKKSEVFQFFKDRYGLEPSPEASLNPFEYTKCTYAHFRPQNVKNIENSQWTEDSNGKFFNQFQADCEKSSFDDCNLEDSFFANLSLS